jgi:hypothetical protein
MERPAAAGADQQLVRVRVIGGHVPEPSIGGTAPRSIPLKNRLATS